MVHGAWCQEEEEGGGAEEEMEEKVEAEWEWAGPGAQYRL
jgi:hypothetical protein